MDILTTVVVLSPQSMFRKGIEITLSTEPDIRIIDSVDFSDGVEYSIEDLPPDVAILDIDSSDSIGFDIAHRLKQRLPNIAIILFSSNPSDEQLFQALKAHASAYLGKEATTEEIITTIKRVAYGEYPINESVHTKSKVADHVLKHFQDFSSQCGTEGVECLTKRETEILDYVARGFSNRQIASSLDISEQTIKNHIASIMRKLNANVRTEAVVKAIKLGLICID